MVKSGLLRSIRNIIIPRKRRWAAKTFHGFTATKNGYARITGVFVRSDGDIFTINRSINLREMNISRAKKYLAQCMDSYLDNKCACTMTPVRWYNLPPDIPDNHPACKIDHIAERKLPNRDVVKVGHMEFEYEREHR